MTIGALRAAILTVTVNVDWISPSNNQGRADKRQWPATFVKGSRRNVDSA